MKKINDKFSSIRNKAEMIAKKADPERDENWDASTKEERGRKCLFIAFIALLAAVFLCFTKLMVVENKVLVVYLTIVIFNLGLVGLSCAGVLMTAEYKRNKLKRVLKSIYWIVLYATGISLLPALFIVFLLQKAFDFSPGRDDLLSYASVIFIVKLAALLFLLPLNSSLVEICVRIYSSQWILEAGIETFAFFVTFVLCWAEFRGLDKILFYFVFKVERYIGKQSGICISDESLQYDAICLRIFSWITELSLLILSFAIAIFSPEGFFLKSDGSLDIVMQSSFINAVTFLTLIMLLLDKRRSWIQIKESEVKNGNN